MPSPYKQYQKYINNCERKGVPYMSKAAYDDARRFAAEEVKLGPYRPASKMLGRMLNAMLDAKSASGTCILLQRKITTCMLSLINEAEARGFEVSTSVVHGKYVVRRKK